MKRVEEVSPTSEFENEPMIFDLRPMTMADIDRKQIRVVQFFSIVAENEPNVNDTQVAYNIMAVKKEGNGMREGNPVSVSISSGADATILPSSYLGVGTELDEGAPGPQDAQGAPIAIKGYKQVCFSFTTEDNKEAQIYEKVNFSDGVNQPIISHGKMMEAGWNINEREPTCYDIWSGL